VTIPAVLAIDGGNSKTDVALVAADGAPLAAVRGPGITGVSDMAATLGVFAGLIERAQREAGRSGRPVAQHMSACVANADLPEEEEALATALRGQGWTHSTEVANDTFAVLWAGLVGHPDEAANPGRRRAGEPTQPTGTSHPAKTEGTQPAGQPERTRPAGQPGVPLPPQRERHWGVAVACGAGINCVGVAPDGRTTGFLALGESTGDWGGGHGLGKAAQWWAMRAEDGRGPQTSLRQAVAAHFGVATVSDVAIGLHKGAIADVEQRGLAPVVLAAASEGDAVAVRLVRRQAEEVCAMALTAMRRLDLTGLATPVVLGGGLMTARDPLLMSSITAGIAERAPRAIVRIVDIPPVAGAALRGLDQQRAGPAAERKLREAYGHALPG
jgi:N-acetylglucosamine kinase-like BadF-type ATPase